MDDKIITQTQETKEPKKKKFDQEKAPVVKTLVEVTEKVAEKKAEEKPMEKVEEKPVETPVKEVKVEALKQKGKVVSVSPYRIIVCDKKGNNVRINGKFNVKVGDEYTF